jgi:hypothetical protein
MRRSDGVTPGGIVLSGVFQSVTAYLTAEDLISATGNTPFEILPAPGVGLMYIIQMVIYNLQFNTIPFSGDGGGAGIWYGGSVSADTGDNNIFNGILSQVQISLSYAALYLQPQPTSVCVDAPLNFWSPNNPLSGGDSTATITIIYNIIEV